MKNIIIFGPPGNEKRTLSEKLSDEFGIKHISSGDIIRKNQKEKTKIGLIADKIINGGGLFPDKIINELLKQEVIDSKKPSGFIFDGFPRTSAQAKMLDQFLNKKGIPITHVIHLDIPKLVVLNRIIKGEQLSEMNDNIDIFKTKWSLYQSQTISAIDYFSGRGKVIKINGDRAIDEVYEEIKKTINEIN